MTRHRYQELNAVIDGPLVLPLGDEGVSSQERRVP